MLLAALDIFFHALHLFVILFNLLGWAHVRTRRAHRWLVAGTAFFWLVIGPLYGALGYCPLTGWHWDVKTARGEGPLPASYIDYLLQMAGIHAPPQSIDIAVGTVFFAVCVVTLYLWRRDKRRAAAVLFKSSSV
ncbi:MAG: DUF2784 family protein [Alphaproteobacteria bacterium]